MNDHARGCEGRNYTCTCGHDAVSTALVERLTKALEQISETRCDHDMGFDREVGPLGCSLGDKCVCVGLCTIASQALRETSALSSSHTSREGER